MSIPFISVGPVTATSTANLTAVNGSVIDQSTTRGNGTFAIQETGGINDISFAIQASLDQIYWYGVDGPSEIPAGTGTNASNAFPGRYIRVQISDGTNGDANATYNLDLSAASSGTFTVTVGGQTTSAQAYNVTDTNLQTALESLSSVGQTIGAGSNVQVSLNSGVYTIIFANALGFRPVALTVNLTSVVGGGTLTTSTVGCTGNIPTSAVYTMTTGGATGGTFTVTVNGVSTAPQAYNVSTANLQTAIQGLSSVGSGNVAVTMPGSNYVITFQGSLANTPVTATANLSGLTGATGAAFTLNTFGNNGHGIAQVNGFSF